MILVLVDAETGAPDQPSLEAVTFGRRLADSIGVPLEAILFGTAPTAERLGAFGVTRVHEVSDERLRGFAPAAWAQAMVDVMAGSSPLMVLASGNDRGNEVMARVASKTGSVLATNCIEVEPADEYHLVTRLRWGGSLLEEARLAGRTKLLTVAPHTVAPEEAPRATPEVLSVAVTLSDIDLRVRVSGREAPEGERISLADARVVVGGGRGVGSPEGFRSLEELAALLGGELGVSRAVTSMGWRPHSQQIGQTGARIAPDLYIACGISGASQHMVGCRAAKTILAINTDRGAPILAHAHHAVIGDLHQVVPALVDEIRRSREGRSS